MQPNEEPQYAIDYLDSISTAPKGSDKGVSDKLFFALIGGGLLIALIVGLFTFLGTGSSSPTDDIARLSAKLQSLQEIADTTQKQLVSSELRGTNSTLSLSLTNANAEIEPLLTANGLEAAKLDPKFIAEQETEAILKELEDAWLNAVIDRSYAREMSYQLETLILLIDQIEPKTTDESLRSFLSSSREKFEPLRDRFAKFNAATS